MESKLKFTTDERAAELGVIVRAAYGLQPGSPVSEPLKFASQMGRLVLTFLRQAHAKTGETHALLSDGGMVTVLFISNPLDQWGVKCLCNYSMKMPPSQVRTLVRQHASESGSECVVICTACQIGMVTASVDEPVDPSKMEQAEAIATYVESRYGGACAFIRLSDGSVIDTLEVTPYNGLASCMSLSGIFPPPTVGARA